MFHSLGCPPTPRPGRMEGPTAELNRITWRVGSSPWAVFFLPTPSLTSLLHAFLRCAQLNNKVSKLSSELKEEQELNKCLRANQVLLQNKLKEEEKVLKETCEQKDLQISEIQEQLRDVMFYLETQQKINHLPAETRQEIQEGQINIAMASSASTPAGGTGKPSSRRGRGKRGK